MNLPDKRIAYFPMEIALWFGFLAGDVLRAAAEQGPK